MTAISFNLSYYLIISNWFIPIFLILSQLYTSFYTLRNFKKFSTFKQFFMLPYNFEFTELEKQVKLTQLVFSGSVTQIQVTRHVFF